MPPLDPGTVSFSEAVTLVISATATDLTDDQEARIQAIVGDGKTEGPRLRLVKRLVYNRLVNDGATLPDGTPVANFPISAVPWAQIIQLLMTLLPTLIPLICPPKPTPSLPASGGA